MSRSEYKPRVSLEDILNSTNGGEDVFRRILGNISYSKNLSAPWRKDSSPSLRLFKGDKVTYQDYGGNQSKGDCIDFVREIYNISFAEALKMIKENFKVEKQKVYTKSVRKEIIEEPTLVEVETMQFQKRHKDYWNKYLLPEKYLRENNVFALKAYAINKKAYIFPEDVAAFGYYAPEADKWKILQIGENVERKWINWIPNNYIHRENKIGDCTELWVVKSLKDALVLNKEFGFCTVALQNESAETFIKFNAKRLENKCKNIVIGLGADPQGVLQSQILTKERGYKYFNTEKYMLKYDCEDFADVIAIFGKEPLKQLLIKKGYLKN